MLNGLQRSRSFWPLLLGSVYLLACSRPPAPAKTPAVERPPAAPAAAPSSAAAPLPPPTAAQEPVESAGFAEAMALLRPAGTEAALQALTSAPGNPEVYAQAALAYAPTDVPGMTLLWALSYQAMGGGAADVAVANALAKVLSERILAKADEHRQVIFNLRLAPGQMPVRQAADGAVEAPLAHAFEALLGPAVTGFQPPWTVEQFYDVLSTWTGVVATHGTALDEHVELDGWLVTLAKAGYLEPFCYRLLGPAFPGELKAYQAKNAAALKAYRDFVKTTPLRPQNALLPDDLVRIK